MHWGKNILFVAPFTRIITIILICWTPVVFIGYNGFTIKIMEVHSYVENTRIGNAENKTRSLPYAMASVKSGRTMNRLRHISLK